MRGRTRLCGLTPVQAPSTSHQVHSCSHQARGGSGRDLCVAPDSQHQAFHSGAVDYNQGLLGFLLMEDTGWGV